MKKHFRHIVSVARTLLVSLCLLTISGWCQAQVCGCTDSLASNYNPSATVNDGSCLYAASVINGTLVGLLDTVLDGTSSLIYWNGGYWTFNDRKDRCMYRINNTDASIMESRCSRKLQITDMEEIAQDGQYLYMGDIGNNYGCRHNLHILRINKMMLAQRIVVSDTIWFSYEDQTDFSELPNYTTDFDCEAFVVTDDSIYLFTKQWVSAQTTVYSLPKTPGTHVAHRRETYNVNGLITGATYLPEYRLIVLCGYDYDSGNIMTALHPFIFLLYDFQGNNFFSGNKRRLDFDTYAKAQIEAIATPNALDYYITNEHFNELYMGLVSLDIPSKLQRLDLRDYLLPYLSGFPDFVDIPLDSISPPTGIPDSPSGTERFRIYPNPAKDKLRIDFPNEFWGAEYTIFNLNGRRVAEGTLREKTIPLNGHNMPAGEYILRIRKDGAVKTLSFIKKG